jgi:hypothetical protein
LLDKSKAKKGEGSILRNLGSMMKTSKPKKVIPLKKTVREIRLSKEKL